MNLRHVTESQCVKRKRVIKEDVIIKCKKFGRISMSYGIGLCN